MARKVINVVYKVDDRELTKTKTAIQGVEKETKDAEKEMLKLDRAVKKTGRDGKKEMDSFGKAINLISVAAITAGVFKLGKTIFDLGVKQEQLNIAFTTFLGSAREAKKVMADLTKFSIVTPFTPDQVNGAAKALLAFGVKGKELIPILKMLGDVSAGTGKDLTEMAVIFGQIRSTGRLMGQDLLQLINAGFNPLQVISEKTGKSVAILKNEMEKGLISFDMVSEAFKTATSEGGLFFNLMEKQSQSIGGIMSTISGNIEEGFKNIFATKAGPIAEFVKVLQTLSESFLNFTAISGGDPILDKATENADSYRVALEAAFKSGDTNQLNTAIAENVKFTNEWRESTQELTDQLADKGKLIKDGLIGDYSRLVTVQQVEAKTVELLASLTQEYINKLIEVAPAVSKIEKSIRNFDANLPDQLYGLPFIDPKKIEAAGDEAYKVVQSYNDAVLKDVIDTNLQELQDRKKTLDEKAKLEEEAANRKIANEQRAKEAAISNATQLAGELASLFLMQREIDTSEIQDKYSLELELAGDNERAKKSIQKRQQEELKKVEQQNKEIQKKNAIANIGINTAQAILKTFVQFGWPAGILPAAVMAGIGLVQVANVRKFKDGEVNIKGPGTSTSDSIPAMLSRGETVITEVATSNSPKLLQAINDGIIDDRILKRLSGNGGRQVGFDDSGIIRAIEKNKVDYITQGYSLYQTTQVGKNFKRTIRSKVQGY